MTIERMQLTFEQAEGIEPLPAQLRLKEISPQLRAALWHRIYRDLINSVASGGSYLGKTWVSILKDEHVYRQHGMVDDFNPIARKAIPNVRAIFEHKDYSAIFGWIEFVLKHPACPPGLPNDIEGILRGCRAAYRVLDKKVICPIGSEAEHTTITKAFADLAGKQFGGARAHLGKAASHLTAGAYADSVRESIHSVEAVGRALDPSADVLSKALKKLEQKISIHTAMKNGFTSLYAYTSDEKGIRHALIDDSAARVDEADALFMLGACAAFVSYLINKARSSGLLS